MNDKKEPRIHNSCKSISENELRKLEAELGVNLPEQYRNFLLRFNGGQVQPDHFRYEDEILDDLGSVIDRFLCLGDDGDFTIGEYLESYVLSNRIASKFLPIASDVGGNVIVLDIKGENVGRVYFWHHELESGDGEPPSEDNIFLIAATFDEFLDSLDWGRDEDDMT